jgi:hypothetical protein
MAVSLSGFYSSCLGTAGKRHLCGTISSRKVKSGSLKGTPGQPLDFFAAPGKRIANFRELAL